MTIDIVVKSGVKPVHGFDLWGTLVDQVVFGPRVIEAYSALASAGAGTDEEKAQIAANIENYQGVLDGKDWATGARKKEFVDGVEEPLWQAYARGEASVNFQGALYADALEVMKDIVFSGEGVCIITTGDSFWIKKALKDASLIVGETMGEVYFGNKSKPEPFEAAALDILAKGGQLVSHTEDQLKGFAGLLASNLKDKLCMVYVERADIAAPLATPEQVKTAGIDFYVRDLRQVLYTKMMHL